jgi:2,3-bisphosphoglycerate-independent phosphoglycerate mutase
MDFEVLKPLLKTDMKTKIVLLVMDGLGGLPMTPGGKTELETANTPNMDALAEKSVLGLQQPLLPGMTPGSGPAHIGLFGYDPIKYSIGRGVLSALGVDFDLKPDDVAARGNFCSVDSNDIITDRRAGRISTEIGAELCKLLSEKINIPGVEVILTPEKEYRFVFVLRGKGLNGEVSDTDPQSVGKRALVPEPMVPDANSTAQLIQNFVSQAAEILKDQHPANSLVLRGFSQLPKWPKFGEVFGLKPLAIAMYPMYRGVAKLVGMNVMPPAHSMDEEIDMLEANWQDHDFFFVHIKKTDSAGEDGNFDLKVNVIEQVDALIPRILALKPDVLIITGDHSTPALMRSHSWHPVPTMIYAELCRPDGINEYGERACLQGSLGPHFPSYEIMPLALAHASRMEKFGA